MEFSCPRCAIATDTEFYGPCPTCRDQLRVSMAREAKVVEVGDYEPKMNVTPNAVALKDD